MSPRSPMSPRTPRNRESASEILPEDYAAEVGLHSGAIDTGRGRFGRRGRGDERKVGIGGGINPQWISRGCTSAFFTLILQTLAIQYSSLQPTSKVTLLIISL
eukprot:scaffold60948_cov18-Tisochrysis_lutea.AAC.1